MAKKPQTEQKAKGLLKNVGNYKGKTLNLSKKQLGASGRAAAGARKIAISRTHYDAKTKKVIGPMGKPITGRVDLGGGNVAVYKNGVRVRAQAPSSKQKGSGPSGGGGGGGGANKPGKINYAGKISASTRVNEYKHAGAKQTDVWSPKQIAASNRAKTSGRSRYKDPYSQVYFDYETGRWSDGN
ncbi:MAG: hypothetical protein KGN78_05665 [Actinomycetales bacterium]|nr:hypothetical protein [Actinomycetales bacterium]